MATPADQIIIATIRGSAQPNISWSGGSQLAELSYNYLTGNRYVNYIPDDGGLYPIYEIGDLLQSQCSGTTLTALRFSSFSPFFTASTEFNSPSCGYTPPSCDILMNQSDKTNCATPDNDDGTITVAASSSYPIDHYELDGPVIGSNITGIFTGLTPGEYIAAAIDENGCRIEVVLTISGFDPTGFTNVKYILEFKAVRSGDDCLVEFIDKNNYYDDTIYPKSIKGTSEPVIRKTANSSEDKTEPICPTQVQINAIHDNTFTIDEFALADERTWFIKYYIAGEIRFQGWLLPDEVQDNYADPLYPVSFVATDGLLSLKGVDYSDDTGIQQFGVFQWKELVYNCLKKLNYNYGTFNIVSSLRFNDTFDNLLWNNISSWADVFYDNNGTPNSSYDVLISLLKGFGLTLFQDGDRLIAVHWNDEYHITNPLKATLFTQALWSFDQDFISLANGLPGVKPSIVTTGFGQQLQPVGAAATVNYDKAFGIEEIDIDFNLLALLYPNPSFEVASVSGQPPIGFTRQEGYAINQMGLINTDSYDGDWSWKFGTSSYLPLANPRNSFVENDLPGFNIDQPQKQVQVSFMWKAPTLVEDIPIDADAGYVPSFGLVFITDSGGAYFLEQVNGKTIEYTEALTGTINPYGDLTQDRWVELSNRFYSEGDIFSIKTQPTTDNIGWQSFSITTPTLPNEGTGRLYVRWYCVKIQLFDSSRYPDSIAYTNKDGLYLYAKEGYYLIDNLDITLADAQDAYNKQVGETHVVKTLTNYAKASKKTIDTELFTYPLNKRMAGNVFYGVDYDSGIVANTWGFSLFTPTYYGRLPAALIKQVARQYQRPVYKIQMDVIFATLFSYHSVFAVAGVPNALFMPLTIEWNDHIGTAKITIVEINDALPSNNYIYRGKFEKSARRVISL